MLTITLPDGSKREYPAPLTVAEVAASIGTGLAKAALGGKIGTGDAAKLVDTSFRIEQDTALAIITDKQPEGLEMIRHSTAHLLAYAVKELFPEAQVTIGPVIEHGFYYDFAYKRPFTPEDLAAIGCTVESTGDVAFIKDVHSTVDKLIKALLKTPEDAE